MVSVHAYQQAYFSSPIAEVITSFGVQFHKYADDTQLYVAVKYDEDVEKLEKCTIAVRDWFTRNGMLLNPDKSEVLLVARKANAAKFAHGTGVCARDLILHTPCS